MHFGVQVPGWLDGLHLTHTKCVAQAWPCALALACTGSFISACGLGCMDDTIHPDLKTSCCTIRQAGCCTWVGDLVSADTAVTWLAHSTVSIETVSKFRTKRILQPIYGGHRVQRNDAELCCCAERTC